MDGAREAATVKTEATSCDRGKIELHVKPQTAKCDDSQ